MNLDELYQRQTELTRQYDDASDALTAISLNIEASSESLMEAKSDYLINPSSGELSRKLKAAQFQFDGLVDTESIAIRERRDLGNAVKMIGTRILTQEHVQETQANSRLQENIPEKNICTGN